MKCDGFKYIYCPQYEGISVKGMMQEAVNCPELSAYLPDSKEIPQLPRQWLANIIYTVYGRRFAEWLDEKIRERNKKLETKNNMLIEMDPAIAAAFAQS